MPFHNITQYERIYWERTAERREGRKGGEKGGLGSVTRKTPTNLVEGQGGSLRRLGERPLGNLWLPLNISRWGAEPLEEGRGESGVASSAF